MAIHVSFTDSFLELCYNFRFCTHAAHFSEFGIETDVSLFFQIGFSI